ncbi:CBS domain-containing protein [Salipiger marinus]|jgi:CBS domain-containing protein|uniref:CBS domain-containing protein n=1 Tax=Salipiger marinus TaxID=555512 RepID=A0A1G8T669_9RHOB|nr:MULTISPECIES: CBS domain-containing protein [Salipiger]HBM58431.1 CBS domain-containing protein [Citreicella sp.]MCD1616934.1 CBS domain-containing protein [Salipiger manganoxidans]MEB3419959.1 CBS domain-containing protein [Salipiger manganoxidans]SDJ37109.1 CBS domain-containing protein [Salipiger marinus]HBS98834.1 CBS domain-containing protein [Citreicella sp.]
MQVQQILRDKGGDGVITVPPQTSVADAAKLLAERRIGGVVISQDGQHPLGILSERDIVRVLAARGASVLEAPVEDLMTRKLKVCTRDEDVNVVLARMTEGRFRHMPVVEDDVLVGIISIGDVVKAQIAELAMEKDALQGMIMGF